MLTDGILLLKQDFATDYFSKVDHYTSPANVGKIDDFFKQHFEGKIDASKDIYSFDGTDAHIRINGPMSPDGPDLFDIFYGYGGVSFADILESVELAAEDVDPKTGKVLFDFNCPGSTVDGVDTTFQAMEKLSETHNTVAVNHGMIASGAMWLSSACRSIETVTPVSFTGSIGVIVAGYDISEMLESMGVKKVVITNHDASEKRADISTSEGQKIIQAELEAIYGVFKDRVLSGRKTMTSESIDALKGSVKIASEAVSLGLIDSIQKTTQTPASAGSTPKEATKMTLKELLAANPDAQAQYNNDLASAKATGKAEGQTELQATIDKVSPFIGNDKYPAVIGETALKVLKGEDSIISLTASVAAVDAVNQQKESKSAESEAAEETPPAGGPQSKEEKAEADFQAKLDEKGRG